MIFTTDDLCLSYLYNFRILDDIKKDHPEFKVIAFTMANFKGNEDVSKSNRFQLWYEKHKDWVEVAVHSNQHVIPEGDQEDEEGQIKQALNILAPFLPKEYGYRPAGWQTTNKTVPLLKKLGFTWIAYESRINSLKVDKTIETNMVNSHLYDINSLNNIKSLITKS